MESAGCTAYCKRVSFCGLQLRLSNWVYRLEIVSNCIKLMSCSKLTIRVTVWTPVWSLKTLEWELGLNHRIKPSNTLDSADQSDHETPSQSHFESQTWCSEHLQVEGENLLRSPGRLMVLKQFDNRIGCFKGLDEKAEVQKFELQQPKFRISQTFEQICLFECSSIQLASPTTTRLPKRIPIFKIFQIVWSF